MPYPPGEPQPYRFPEVYCSHCAQSFGPGNHGFSHCEDHRTPEQQAKIDAEENAFQSPANRSPKVAPLSHPKLAPRFIAYQSAVMQSGAVVGRMISKTMAKRAANALNRHKPNKEGV